MTTPHDPIRQPALAEGPARSVRRHRWRRLLLASAATLSLGVHDAAWAVCSDGSTFPPGGFVVGSAQLPTGNNWPSYTMAPTGSFFIPDASVNEANDPSKPLTGGGHDWAFDTGLCKVTDTGAGGAVATGWSLPFNLATDCVLLPVTTIVNGQAVRHIEEPFQGGIITPTCDPTILASSSNTYFNQLGCSISHGVARDAQRATTYAFVAGIQSGLFSVRLDNVANPQLGGDAGKVVGPVDNYSAIPAVQKFTDAAISSDGRIAIVTSNRKLQAVFACLNPLGDPGDPTKPINLNFTVPAASTVQCMQVGNNNLAVDVVTKFGPDNQPYFGGQRLANAQNATVNSFNGVPGGASKAAWPNCIWQNNGSSSLADAFAHNRANGCNNAQANTVVASQLTSELINTVNHGSYMYAAQTGGPVVQFKVTVDPVTGVSNYAFRNYLSGITAPVIGVGVADDLQSLIVYSNPITVAAVFILNVARVPLCEDMVP
jgi:hypothetical protein